METIEDSHIPEDMLSRYAFHGIPSEDTGVTNHLIACDDCHEVYEHHLNLKAALIRSNTAETTAAQRSGPGVHGWPKTMWAAVAALLLVAFMVPSVPRQSSESQVLDVVAVRGGQAVQARSNVPLVLRLDTTGLDVPSNVPVDVVNFQGSSVWKGSAQQVNSKWQTKTETGFRKGRYWVRITDPAHPGELLREFQLEVN
jgi:hypothetical protein